MLPTGVVLLIVTEAGPLAAAGNQVQLRQRTLAWLPPCWADCR